MIYDMAGNQLNSAYGLNGGLLSHAYDLDGNDVMEESHYAIDNVVSYFQTSTLSVASDINSLSDEWTSFIYITDPHGSGNKNHSQAIGLYLLDNTKANKIILGGDYSVSNWSKTEYDTYVAPYLESDMMANIYALFGNHEMHGTGAMSQAKSAIYQDFLSGKSNIYGNPQENYYYFDDANKKIRYMCLNTSDESETKMSSTQIAWISSNVVLPASDWSLLVIGHITLNSMGGITYMNETNGADIISAIKGCNGTIIGYLCGHQHVDILYDDGDIHHSTLYTDKFENTNYYSGYSITDRVAGTTTEQAVTVVSINPATKDVVFRRIGVGKQRTMAYSYA